VTFPYLLAMFLVEVHLLSVYFSCSCGDTSTYLCFYWPKIDPNLALKITSYEKKVLH
jgi:hypothetical protein